MSYEQINMQDIIDGINGYVKILQNADVKSRELSLVVTKLEEAR